MNPKFVEPTVRGCVNQSDSLELQEKPARRPNVKVDTDLLDTEKGCCSSGIFSCTRLVQVATSHGQRCLQQITERQRLGAHHPTSHCWVREKLRRKIESTCPPCPTFDTMLHSERGKDEMLRSGRGKPAWYTKTEAS